MPWNGESEMEKRKAFVKRAIQPKSNISALCRMFGISRSVGHKLLKRYREEGAGGVAPRSRCPKNHALAVSADMVCQIVSYKAKHPTWGAKKIRELLVDSIRTAPSVRSVNRVLDRAGLVKHRRRTRGKWLDRDLLIKATINNQVWTVDFKGWWWMKNGKPVFPLTVRDAHSRCVLGIFALSGTGFEGVKECFIELFEQYGMPDSILTDNGSPFASVLSVQGLTRLSAWWVKLGIMPRRIFPACPFMNGSHERMHKDMKEELQSAPAWNLKEEQKRFDEWRGTYNIIRPNEAIGMKRPANVYTRSQREFPDVMPEYRYSSAMEVRRTSSRGYISWHQKPFFISGAIPLETIGIRAEENLNYSLWLCELKLGETNFRSPLGGNSASPYSFRNDRNKRLDL